MANLKGSSFQKQIKNALIRLDQRGVKRHETGSKLTHSNSLYIKRTMYLQNFADFLQQKNITEGKLNTYLTNEYLSEFFNERLSNLSPKTGLDFITGFNSLLQGLQQTNVSINKNAFSVTREYTQDYRSEFNSVKNSFETGRAVNDIKGFLSDLKEIRESSAIIANLQLETGLRISEALQVARDFDSYYQPQNSEISGIVGKGGQEYQPKIISVELAEKLNNFTSIPSYGTYYKDLKELQVKPHDLRVSYAKNYYQELREKGHSHREALKAVSQQLNHHRESITLYYLSRA